MLRRSTRALLAASITLSAASSLQAAGKSAAALLGGGKLTLNTRYRYEYYEQDSQPATSVSGPAYASTLRFAPGYRTPELYGFAVYGEYQVIARVGPNHYRMPTVPNLAAQRLPVISDPRTHDFNQHYIQYADPAAIVKLTAGRLALSYGNGRFVNNSEVRQFQQSFNAVSVDLKPLEGVVGRFAYAAKVYRVTGQEATDGVYTIRAPMFHLSYRRAGIAQISVYGLLLDNRGSRTDSTKTFGLRVEGPYACSDTVELLYAAEYADQTNYAGNPNHVDQGYWLGDVGASYKGWSLRAQINERQASSATDKLTTPLTRPWDGWVEKFVLNPSAGSLGHGLQVRSLTASGGGKAPVPVTLTLIGYDYYASSSRLHYGAELDAGVEVKPLVKEPRLTVGCRFGRYFADRLFTDSLRSSIFVSFVY